MLVPCLFNLDKSRGRVGIAVGIQVSLAHWMTSDEIFSMTRAQKTLAQSQTMRFAECVYILSVSLGCSKPMGRCCLYLLSLLTWLPPRSLQGLGLCQINYLLAWVTKKSCRWCYWRERWVVMLEGLQCHKQPSTCYGSTVRSSRNSSSLTDSYLNWCLEPLTSLQVSIYKTR